MIDLHTHVLPGLDDGAADLEESLALALASAGDGIELIAATPHVRDDYPTRPGVMERLVDEVRAALSGHGIALELRPGGEVALDRLGALGAEDLRRFGLGGNPGYLLLEFPYRGWPLDLHERAFRLQAAGITPVLAHPERNGEVQDAPELLEPLVASGVLVQLTAASVDGRLGGAARRSALRLLDLQLAHMVASDAHGPSLREAGMGSAVSSLGNGRLAQWLTRDVPAAIVEGEPLPPRPGHARRRWWSRVARRR